MSRLSYFFFLLFRAEKANFSKFNPFLKILLLFSRSISFLSNKELHLYIANSEWCKTTNSLVKREKICYNDFITCTLFSNSVPRGIPPVFHRKKQIPEILWKETGKQRHSRMSSPFFLNRLSTSGFPSPVDYPAGAGGYFHRMDG